MPCAGHIRAKTESLLCLNEPNVSELVENFGFAEPTGSKIVKNTMGDFFLLPE